jgi:hypothetical protein
VIGYVAQFEHGVFLPKSAPARARHPDAFA